MLEKIEDYINDAMSPQERLLFEAEMANDKSLADTYRWYKTIEEEMRIKGTLRKEAETLNNLLTNVGRKYRHLPTSPNVAISDKEHRFSRTLKLNLWVRLVAAAAVIGVIVLSTIWLVKKDRDEMQAATKTPYNSILSKINPSESLQLANNAMDTTKHEVKTAPIDMANNRVQVAEKNEAIFAKNFEPDATPKVQSDLIEEPLAFYDKKDYKKAINTLELTLDALETRGMANNKVDINKFQTHYYLALSYMAAGINTTKAINELQAAMVQTPNRYLKIKTQWYLSLAYIKTGNLTKANSLLDKISASSYAGEYRQKAIQLLDETRY